MKISEVIEKLKEIQKKNGDLTVCIQHRDDGGEYSTFEVTNPEYYFCVWEEEIDGKKENVVLL